MIKILDTAFPEIKIVSREVFIDSRGDFSELFNQNEFPNFFPGGFAQANLSSSSMGVVRGMHWQVPPFQQGKLVSCLSGKVFDVAVDQGIFTQKGAWIYQEGELFAQGRENAITNLRDNTELFNEIKNKIKDAAK